MFASVCTPFTNHTGASADGGAPKALAQECASRRNKIRALATTIFHCGQRCIRKKNRALARTVADRRGSEPSAQKICGRAAEPKEVGANMKEKHSEIQER